MLPSRWILTLVVSHRCGYFPLLSLCPAHALSWDHPPIVFYERRATYHRLAESEFTLFKMRPVLRALIIAIRHKEPEFFQMRSISWLCWNHLHGPEPREFWNESGKSHVYTNKTFVTITFLELPRSHCFIEPVRWYCCPWPKEHASKAWTCPRLFRRRVTSDYPTCDCRLSGASTSYCTQLLLA